MLANYQPLDIISTDDYGHVLYAWIAPNGCMLYVKEEGHGESSRLLGFMSVTAAERAGYIHLSGGMFVDGYASPTKEQIDTVLLYCSAMGRRIPDFVELSPIPPITEPTMSNKYRTGMSNRKLRELFYPNNGD